ncbi:MAG: alpha/beta fold hydrolase [Chloroflexi bacterium]|nr:alpha/beta fold hydrolase [Chloroflexota bacterium]
MTNGAWEVAGPDDGPLIVFIHGTRLTRTSWRAVVLRLSDTYRCLCVDLPGHGALADEPFSLDAAADCIDAAIDDAHGGPAVLVGLSLGGYVAMTAAARSPGRVRGLVLTGSTAEPSGITALAFRLFAWALVAAPERQLDALNTWAFRRRYPAEIAEPIVAAGYWPRGGAVAVRSLTKTRFRDRLRAYGGPTLVINGGLDLIFRLGERSFLRDIPNVSRRVLPLSGHLTPLDLPDAFASAVRAFMERLEN